MHTFTGPGGSIFNFNTDFSGDLYVSTKNGSEIAIPGEDILELVAKRFVLKQRIAMLEDSGEDTPDRVQTLKNMTAEELLRGLLLIV
ncbi:MAG: hypothetical protein NTX25_23265 [Proteobacteria bacterium]|nr:hypothetical protein [Pseudomonadota bacterium]